MVMVFFLFVYSLISVLVRFFGVVLFCRIFGMIKWLVRIFGKLIKG